MLRVVKYAAVAVLLAFVASFAVSDRHQKDTGSITFVSAPAKAPDQEDQAACVLMGNYAFKACSRGYFINKGNEDHASPEYVFGNAACQAGAQFAYNGCVNNSWSKYATAPANECTDLERYITDAISTGCVKTFQANPSTEAQAFSKSCINKWAASGAADFRKFCEKQVAKQKAENSKSTPL